MDFAPAFKNRGGIALELSATSAAARSRLQLSTATAIPTTPSTVPAEACTILTEAPTRRWPILGQALLPTRTVDPRVAPGTEITERAAPGASICRLSKTARLIQIGRTTPIRVVGSVLGQIGGTILTRIIGTVLGCPIKTVLVGIRCPTLILIEIRAVLLV